MKPKVGDLCQVTHSHNGYEKGITYEIARVDTSDDTVTLRRPGDDDDGSWINWSELLPASTVNYDTIKETLSSEVRAFLNAFDGLKRLRLREDCQAELINEIPQLDHVLIRTVKRLDEKRFESMDIFTLNNEAIELTQQGDYDESIARLSIAIKRQPKEKAIQSNLAWALLLKGEDLAQAYELFKSSQEEVRNSSEAWRSAWRRFGLHLSELSLSGTEEGRQEAHAELREAYEVLRKKAPKERKRQARERIRLISDRLPPLSTSEA